MNMDQKKPAIMMRDHIVRVMKLAFFFSYSVCGGSAGDCCACVSGGCRQRGARGALHTGGSFLISLFTTPLRVGLSGFEPVSLISDMLVLSRRALPLLARPLWLNLTSFRGRAMAV
jgi:hypothetical protein